MQSFVDVYDKTEFPVLTASSLTSKVESQITQIFFNLNCPEDSIEIRRNYMQIVDVLKQIKQGMNGNQKETYNEYLNTLYRMVGYTRDVREGKGDRAGSYVMLMAFHVVYPVLAQYALYAFVYGDANEEWQYGSWRDIGPMCDMLRIYSNTRDNHSLIDQMIEYANKQLSRDIEIWKYAYIRRDHKSLLLSNVSKWIPREGKKYDWVFDRLYCHWAEQHYPYILKSSRSNDDSYIRARLKCKQLYRKAVAKLNRAIDTPEIKMCATQWHNIEPQTVGMYTYIKHIRALTGGGVSKEDGLCGDNHIKKQICALKYKLFSTSIQGVNTGRRCPVNTGHPIQLNDPMGESVAVRKLPPRNEIRTNENADKNVSSAFLPIGYMVKRMVEIMNREQNKQAGDGDECEETYLNEQWKKMSDNIGCSDKLFILPIVDVSLTMWEKEEQTVYSAIGLAMLTAMRSGLQNRIIAMDRCATWISWETNACFSSAIRTVMSEIQTMQKTRINLPLTLELIAETMVQSGSTARFIENTTIILFSDYRNNILEENIQEKCLDVSVVYWNLGHSENDISTLEPNRKNKYISGNTLSVLKTH